MTTGKPSKKTTPSLSALATDLFTSHEYNDVTGAVTINTVDALMAIAHAITRLAAAQQALVEQQAQMLAAQQRLAALAAQRAEAMMERALGGDGAGHA
jgi:hypothetical protein